MIIFSKHLKHGLSAFGIAVLLVGCNTKTGSSNENEPKVHVVEITDMKFSPQHLVVHKGDTIVFNNHDLVTHDVTEETTKAWTSSKLPAGESWTMVATTSCDYYCKLHPPMKGKIIVE